MFNAFNTVITVDPITAPRQLGETVVVTDIADPRAVTLEAVADRDAASAGTPSPVTAAIGIAPGSTVRIVKYCVDPAGSVTLVLATTDRSAVACALSAARLSERAISSCASSKRPTESSSPAR